MHAKKKLKKKKYGREQKIIGVYQDIKSSLSAKVIARDKYIRRSALGPNLQKTIGANKKCLRV